MRTFKGFTQNGSDVCPICGTNKDKEIILVPIKGTEDGNNIQALQVHTDCLQDQLMYYPKAGNGFPAIIAAGAPEDPKLPQSSLEPI